jgi:type IV pilus assembly protein PilC
MRIETTLNPPLKKKVLHEKQNNGNNIWKRDISIAFFSNDNSFKSHFYSEMSVLIGSGMDIRKSLEIVCSSTSKGKEILVITNIISSIVNGASFSNALSESDVFSLYDISSIKIGEESGALTDVLCELSVYYAKRISQKRQISGALTYPVLVLITTIFSLVFMLNYIVPMFENVFLRFKGTLPPLTRTIIKISDSFLTYVWIILIILIGIFIIGYMSRKEEWFRKLSSGIVLSLPIIKNVVKLNYKVRYCQTMRLLISSKVHLLDAIDLLSKIIGFYPVEKALNEIKIKISNGISLAAAMEEYQFFDKKMIAMTKVAEEVNKLDILYDQLYRQYSEELDVRIKTMNSLIEPILIIFVGALVGIILISMYMPIFQLGTSIGV